MERWLTVACAALVSMAIGALWSLDRRRTRDEVVLDFGRDYLRLVLSLAMFTYGVMKLKLDQFNAFDDFTLYETYADSSPMGLMWRFMGYSPTYQRFAGFAEVLGAMALLSRRITTFGALVISAVMLNVVLTNFCFDVPAKIYSSHLLLGAVVLLTPELRRLVAVLFNFATVAPRELAPKYVPRGVRVSRRRS